MEEITYILKYYNIDYEVSLVAIRLKNCKYILFSADLHKNWLRAGLLINLEDCLKTYE